MKHFRLEPPGFPMIPDFSSEPIMTPENAQQQQALCTCEACTERRLVLIYIYIHVLLSTFVHFRVMRSVINIVRSNRVYTSPISGTHCDNYVVKLCTPIRCHECEMRNLKRRSPFTILVSLISGPLVGD